MNILMIGVITEQNTTNLIPALQYEITEAIFIETQKAKADKWGDGLCKILEGRNITVADPVELSLEEDGRIDKILEHIAEEIVLEDYDRIVWNLGGGQKQHQFPLWQLFVSRQNKDTDIACYVDPWRHVIEEWSLDDGRLIHNQKEVSIHLSLDEAIMVYNFEKAEGDIFYKRGTTLPSNGVTDLMSYPEFRTFAHQLSLNHPMVKAEEEHITKAELRNYLTDKNLNKVYKNLWKTRLNNTLNIFKSYHPKNDRINTQNDFAKQLQSKLKQQGSKVSRSYNECVEHAENSIGGQTRTLVEQALKPLYEVNVERPEFEFSTPEVLQIFSEKGIVLPIKDEAKVFQKLAPHKELAKFSYYFEAVLEDRLHSLLQTLENHVVEAYSNVKVMKQGSKGVIEAEYDILLLTEWGTLIAIDAKTFDFDKKDADARLLNLQNVGGRFVKFVAVLPYHPDDIEKGLYPSKLKALPQNLKAKKIDFWVVADGLDHVSISLSDGHTIQCPKIENILQGLKLIRQK